MLLTMADMGGGGGLGTTAGPLLLHGPPGLVAMTAALRTFVNTREMGLRVGALHTTSHPIRGCLWLASRKDSANYDRLPRGKLALSAFPFDVGRDAQATPGGAAEAM